MTKLGYVCYLADETTFHTWYSSVEDLVYRLEHDANLAIQWFDYNYMKLNEDKCYLIISGHKSEGI